MKYFIITGFVAFLTYIAGATLRYVELGTVLDTVVIYVAVISFIIFALCVTVIIWIAVFGRNGYYARIDRLHSEARRASDKSPRISKGKVELGKFISKLFPPEKK